MNMVWLDCNVKNLAAKFTALFLEKFNQAAWDTICQNFAGICWYPNKVVIDVVSSVSGSFDVHNLIIAHLFLSDKLSMRKETRPFPPR